MTTLFSLFIMSVTMLQTQTLGTHNESRDFGKQSFEVDKISNCKPQIGNWLEIVFIKHGTLMLNYLDGTNYNVTVYIDPVSEYADFSQFPPADLILITHDHSDHFDPKAIAQLAKENTTIIINETAQKKLPANLPAKIIVLKNGETFDWKDFVKIEAVPAYNTTAGREKYHPKGRDNGYIVDIGAAELGGTTRIYIAGDTEAISEMENFGKPDIAFLPINQPYTMTPQQAAQAAAMLKSPVIYPYHFGDTNIEAIKKAFAELPEIDLRIRRME